MQVLLLDRFDRDETHTRTAHDRPLLADFGLRQQDTSLLKWKYHTFPQFDKNG